MGIHFVERPYDEFINVFATPKATNLAAHGEVTGSTTHENIIDLIRKKGIVHAGAGRFIPLCTTPTVHTKS